MGRNRQLLNYVGVCNCLPRESSASAWSIWTNTQLLRKVIRIHRKDCPLAGGSQHIQTHVIGVRFFYIRSLLSKALEMSLALTCGAAGYSLASSIQLRTLLRDDSPAFRLFDWEQWSATKARLEPDENSYSDYLDHMTQALRKLRIWFSEGKASPNDIDIDGKTILQVLQCNIFRVLSN